MIMPRIQISIQVKINQDNTKEKLRSVFRDAMPESKVRTSSREHLKDYVYVSGNSRQVIGVNSPNPHLTMHVDIRDESIDGIKSWSDKYMDSIKQGFKGYGLELHEVQNPKFKPFTIKVFDQAVIAKEELA